MLYLSIGYPPWTETRIFPATPCPEHVWKKHACCWAGSRLWSFASKPHKASRQTPPPSPHEDCSEPDPFQSVWTAASSTDREVGTACLSLPLPSYLQSAIFNFSYSLPLYLFLQDFDYRVKRHNFCKLRLCTCSYREKIIVWDRSFIKH